ncbi:MAG TPA: tetratricopeptide repeat protein [Candidatus Dormibacteraeota bacterium]|nr:tetratricopeptide repeat protein [Candidatus Dormibacteraeota bacterium]
MPPKTKPTLETKPGLFTSAEKRNPVVCLLLAVITLALYNPVNRHPFVNYDDDRYVTENPHIRQGLTADAIAWSLTSTEQANWHPLTWMSHALDVSLFRLNPAGHHLISVLLHIVNACLLFLLLMWATNRLGPALFVAALFALHPINVESVAWIAERKNVLCTLFFFLTLWAYGWYAQKPGWKRYLVVFTLFAAGLASKPMVITLPFVLLLLDYWPLDRAKDRAMPPWSRLVLEKLPLFALSAASAIITMQAQQAGGAVRSVTEFSFGVRIANAIYAYAMYLWKMLWPARLAPLYPHPGDSLSAARVLLAAVVLLAITAVVWKFREKPYLLVGWLFFLGTLVPVIGLVQVGEAAMADRYAYIPLIGIFMMIAFTLDDWAQQKKLNWPPAVAAVAVAIALVLATHRQIGYWQTNESLWAHALAVTENNFIAEDNLGGALILAGEEEEAHTHFAAAARINPKDPMSHSNLGTYYQTHNQMREAVKEYEAAVEMTSDPGLLAQTYANLGAAYRVSGDDERAQTNYKQSLRYNPNQFNAWFGLGALALKQGKLDEAILDLSRSIELHPAPETYLALGRALEQKGRAAEALAAYQEAVKLSPDFTEAQQAAAALRR